VTINAFSGASITAFPAAVTVSAEQSISAARADAQTAADNQRWLIVVRLVMIILEPF
jgi:hypothetical protein